MTLKKGQLYEINSLDLGFINVDVTNMVIELVEVDYEHNSLVLAPALLPDTYPNKSLISITNWFRDEYPKQEKGKLIINNPYAFEKLVDLKIAVFYECRRSEN